MNNYQLYRTNVKLGGQVAWNLVLEDLNGDLIVKYFDLTPISPYVNYKYGQNTDCVRYTHSENLRTLYKEIKGQFYDACINPRLKTIYPIIDDPKLNTHDSSLEMGCSRLSYKRYNKQLQVLCPLWLEDFNKEKTLSFKISLYTNVIKDGESKENILASKCLDLKLLNQETYHNQFVRYFKDYVDQISTNNTIGDDVLNINITDKFASVNGLDIKTGKVVSKDISNLVPNMFERERPLMETDFMLIDNFHTSEMVAKQLFNFNLVFDIADLVSNIMDNMLKDNKFFIKVEVGTTNMINQFTPFTIKSFDNNYSSLEKSTGFKDILTYLQDDKCIDIIRDNKLAPDICHWNLSDNDNYIFNLYPGFATIYPMFYKDSPNYWEYSVGEYPNVLNWLDGDKTPNNLNVILTRSITDPEFTIFDTQKGFFKDTRVNITNSDYYDLQPEYLCSNITTGNLNVTYIINQLKQKGIEKCIFIVSDQNQPSGFNYFLFGVEGDYDDVGIHPNIDNFVVLTYTQLGRHFIVFTNEANQNKLSYKWLSKALTSMDLSKINRDNHDFETIQAMINSVVYPKIIYIYNTLNIVKADSPWLNTDEIYYVKNNNVSTTVIRYDGKIKPMFSDIGDLVWYKVRKMSETEFKNDPVFQKDQTKGFLPNYPSLGYFNLEYISNEDFYWADEYKWFNESRVFNLIPSFEVKEYSKLLDYYYSNDKLIEKVLQDLYPNLSQTYIDYIRSLYNIDISYEYDNPAWSTEEEQFNYIYTIKLELK